MIIPAYNRAHMLPDALDSIRDQSYRPIEVVVVDDGSTDDTREVVAAWRRANAAPGRLAVRYVHQENSGLSASRNAGAIACRGEYVQFLDSDDYLLPDRFRTVVEAAAAVTGFEVATTGFHKVGPEGNVIERYHPINLAAGDPVDTCIRRPLWAGGPVFARGLLRRAGLFNPDVTYAEDWEFGIRVALMCRPAGCIAIDRPLVCYREHGGPRIMTDRRTTAEMLMLFRVAAANLASRGVARRYHGLLALGLLQWFMRHGEPAYLREAVRLACPAALKAKLAAALFLAAAGDIRPAVRLWSRFRRSLVGAEKEGAG